MYKEPQRLLDLVVVGSSGTTSPGSHIFRTKPIMTDKPQVPTFKLVLVGDGGTGIYICTPKLTCRQNHVCEEAFDGGV